MYEMVMEMKQRQGAVDERLDTLDDSIRLLRVNTYPILLITSPIATSAMSLLNSLTVNDNACRLQVQVETLPNIIAQRLAAVVTSQQHHQQQQQQHDKSPTVPAATSAAAAAAAAARRSSSLVASGSTAGRAGSCDDSDQPPPPPSLT